MINSNKTLHCRWYIQYFDWWYDFNDCMRYTVNLIKENYVLKFG